jgi:WD40 repeat protein
VPKIADYGLAKLLDEEATHTRSGAVIGTPNYMAPEQADARGREVGPAADVWALGVILYELLTGRLPFRGATTAETLLRVRFDEPLPPARVVPAVPRDLETVCLKCLEKEPARRYATAAALAEDLRRFLAGEPVQARRAGRLERAVKWARRRPAAAGLVAAALVVAGLAAGLVAARARLFRAGAEASRLKEEKAAADRRRDGEEEAAARVREEAAQRTFGVQLARASLAWRRDPAAALRLLDDEAACPAGRRDAAWQAWRRACLFDRAGLVGQDRRAERVAFAPDGSLVAFVVVRQVGGEKAEEVHVRDAARAALRHHFGLDRGCVGTRLAFTPDGRLLTALVTRGGGRRDSLVLTWDMTTGQVAGRRDVGAGDVAAGDVAELLPDGRSFVMLSGDGVWLHEAAGGDPRHVCLRFAWGHGRQPSTQLLPGAPTDRPAVAVSPDGATLAVSLARPGPGAVRLIDLRTGKETDLPGPEEEVLSLAFRSDGKALAGLTCARPGKPGKAPALWLWDVARGEGKALADCPAASGNLTRTVLNFTPDGQEIRASISALPGVCRTTVASWEADRGRERPAAQLPLFGPVTFSPDGRSVAGCGNDKAARVWDLAGGERLVLAGPAHVGAVTDLAVAPAAGLLVSVGKDLTLRLWGLADGTERHVVRDFRGPFALAADGSAVAVVVAADRPEGAPAFAWWAVRVVDAGTGRARAVFEPGWPVLLAVALSPDGRLLAVAGSRRLGRLQQIEVRLWDVATGRELPPPMCPPAELCCLAFSPDGRHLLAGTDQGEVRAWVAATGEPRKSARAPHGASALAFTPDGRYVVAAGEARRADGKPADLRFSDWPTAELVGESRPGG